jgi:hypothetical protein
MAGTTVERWKVPVLVLRSTMNDFTFVAIILAFFVLAALFVTACDRIIGADDEAFAGSPAVGPEQESRAA